MYPALFSDACWIIRTLKAHGFKAFIAGGAVRDLLLGNPPQDYDIATTASPEDITALFPLTKKVGKAFGTMLIVVAHRPYQVTTLESSGGIFSNVLEKDIFRRDFTVNAMFWDPLEDRLIDIVGGMKDLKTHILTPVTSAENIFQDDPIRMLRAIRLSHSLQFTLHPSVLPAIRTLRSQIHKVSPERIQYELVKILSLDHVLEALCPVVKTRLLFELLPELALLSHLKQSPYHDYSALSHTFRTLAFTEELYHKGLFLNNETSVKKYILMLAALLHDVGKPATHTIAGNAHHFYGHEKIGAEIAKGILKRLRFSKKDILSIKFLVERHMYPLHLHWLKEKNALTERAIQRFRRKTKEKAPALLLLSAADQLAKQRKESEPFLTSWLTFCKQLQRD